ncbi:MAG: MBL fold metallo-hydrolase [bacterium]
MKIEFLGHSTFLITTKDTIRIITDPYESGAFGGALRYKPIDVEADIVTISHSHADHNHHKAVKGNPTIVKDAGEHTVKDIKIEGLNSYHDKSKGSERGKNIIYMIEAERLKLAHLGDLGCEPPIDIIERLKNLDVLIIPVGGTFTIDADEAKQLIDMINPKLVIPMHFRTHLVSFPLDSVDRFTSLFEKDRVRKVDKSIVEIDINNLPSETEVIELAPSRT